MQSKRVHDARLRRALRLTESLARDIVKLRAEMATLALDAQLLASGPEPSIDRQLALKLYREGRTREQIAEELGCSYEVVRRQLAAALKAATTRMISDGKSVLDVAAELGCSTRDVRQWIK